MRDTLSFLKAFSSLVEPERGDKTTRFVAAYAACLCRLNPWPGFYKSLRPYMSAVHKEIGDYLNHKYSVLSESDTKAVRECRPAVTTIEGRIRTRGCKHWFFCPHCYMRRYGFPVVDNVCEAADTTRNFANYRLVKFSIDLEFAIVPAKRGEFRFPVLDPEPSWRDCLDIAYMSERTERSVIKDMMRNLFHRPGEIAGSIYYNSTYAMKRARTARRKTKILLWYTGKDKTPYRYVLKYMTKNLPWKGSHYRIGPIDEIVGDAAGIPNKYIDRMIFKFLRRPATYPPRILRGHEEVHRAFLELRGSRVRTLGTCSTPRWKKLVETRRRLKNGGRDQE